jgi:dUTP pyrophosphatase
MIPYKYFAEDPTVNNPPKYGSVKAAAFDLQSSENVAIPPGKVVGVHTGFHVECPAGYYLAIHGRSGLAVKHGIIQQPTGAIVDEDYRGEVIVGLYNTTGADFLVCKGDRVAQAILTLYDQAEGQQVGSLSELSSTERGEAGLGSTGSKPLKNIWESFNGSISYALEQIKQKT